MLDVGRSNGSILAELVDAGAHDCIGVDISGNLLSDTRRGMSVVLTRAHLIQAVIDKYLSILIFKLRPPMALGTNIRRAPCRIAVRNASDADDPLLSRWW